MKTLNTLIITGLSLAACVTTMQAGPLHTAVINNNPKAIKALLVDQKVLKIIHSCPICMMDEDQHRFTIMCKNGHAVCTDCFKKLAQTFDRCSYGCKKEDFRFIDQVNEGNQTALHLAAYFGYREMVQLLIENKANLYMKTNDNISPLEIAALQGRTFIFAMLVTAGAATHETIKNLTKLLSQVSNTDIAKMLEGLIEKRQAQSSEEKKSNK